MLVNYCECELASALDYEIGKGFGFNERSIETWAAVEVGNTDFFRTERRRAFGLSSPVVSVDLYLLFSTGISQ